MSAALENAKRLIAAESVTPATGEVFDVLEAQLTPRAERAMRGQTTPRSRTSSQFGLDLKDRSTSPLRGIWT